MWVDHIKKYKEETNHMAHQRTLKTSFKFQVQHHFFNDPILQFNTEKIRKILNQENWIFNPFYNLNTSMMQHSIMTKYKLYVLSNKSHVYIPEKY